jgi:hypothetical protein
VIESELDFFHETFEYKKCNFEILSRLNGAGAKTPCFLAEKRAMKDGCMNRQHFDVVLLEKATVVPILSKCPYQH